MMPLRCQSCAWQFTLSQDAIARAIAESQARNEPSHAFVCPQCGQPTSLEVADLRQRLPDSYPLPEVKFSHTPVVKALTAESVESELSWNIAVIPTWDPKTKRNVTVALFRASVIGVAVMWLITLAWLIMQHIGDAEARPLPTGVDLAVVLAPVLAAAAGVERFLETIFGIIEQQWHSLVAYLGRGMRWLHNAETEVQQARKWLADLSNEATQLRAQMPITLEQLEAAIPDQIDRGQTINEWQTQAVTEAQKRLDVVKSMMALAEARLSDAENELSAATSSASYKNAKSVASIILGLWLGVIVATAGQLQMFAMLGVGVVPAKVDVLITGLIIGSGSYPVHSLVGLLQQAKNTLDSTQQFLKSKSSPGE